MSIKIKVCGITNLEDGLIVSKLGADALGFIFAPSPRNIEPETAKNIIEKLPPFITAVGVFKNEPLDVVNRIIRLTGIDAIQLHGAEPPEYCRLIKGVRIIKRIKIDDDSNPNDIIKEMAGYSVSAYLFDPGEGSGNIFDWKIIKGIKGTIIVGGGLNQKNVKTMIEILKPYGVDVCSGVEMSPGKKDPEKIQEFIKEVRRCSLQV
uniref:N-(5'-phosphoribosyl)anthranilate isomerase n=1 Tax=candidate division WOR-3 bacterium TaxID=2052148 RepID=A0A7V0Z7G8_UNCW3